jgi:hypothetical protein
MAINDNGGFEVLINLQGNTRKTYIVSMGVGIIGIRDDRRSKSRDAFGADKSHESDGLNS